MGDPLILQEKENSNTPAGETSRKRGPLRNLSMGDLRSIKKDVRTKIERNDVVLSKLDKTLEDLKELTVRIVNIIDECQMLVKAQRKDCKELQHLLRDTTWSRTCKTNIVNPMVAGIPLKRACISLKRLGPMKVQGYGRVLLSGSRVINTSENRNGQQDEEMNLASDDASSHSALHRGHSRL